MNLLIYPPFVDPTQPYLALPMLLGYLRQQKLSAQILDLNILSAHFILDRSYIINLAQRLGQRFAVLNQQNSLTFLEQWEYLTLLRGRKLLSNVLSCNIPFAQFFQNPDRFYQPDQYFWARDSVNELWEIINAVYFPYQYNFNSAGHLVAPWDWDSLNEYWTARRSPVDELYQKILTPLFENTESIDLVGISLSFVSQIPEAFYLCHKIREMSKECFIVLGGACIHQIFMHSQSDVCSKILSLVNGVALFEGEELLAQLIRVLPQWQSAKTAKERQELLQNIPNLAILNVENSLASAQPLDIAHGSAQPLVTSPQKKFSQLSPNIHYGPIMIQDLSNPALPDYSDLDLDSYLSPSRTLLYAPTRGCYWNKCSFCEYGFNQSGTHNYREVPYHIAVDQMEHLSRQYGVKNFYISCDVMSPKYVLDFANLIAEKKLPIHWNSDLRIEKFYTKEVCTALYKGGCRAIAFGIESGSNRVLQIMHKGTTIEQIMEINRNFHDCGIATAWMMFHFHPGETGAEAMQTIALVEQQFKYVDLFIIGEFELTPGSRIACHPQEYGISKIYHAIGDEFHLYPMFQEQPKNHARKCQPELDEHVANLASNFVFSRYPWAGAISTHHTFLYFLRYGQRAYAGGIKIKSPKLEHTKFDLKITGLSCKPRFSIQELETAQTKFLAKYSKLALRPDDHLSTPLCKIHYLSTPLCKIHFEHEAEKMPNISTKPNTSAKKR